MANPYFNAAYYLAHNPDVAAAVAGLPAADQLAIAEEHYDLHGAGEGRQPNAWFDPVAYLNQNPDLGENGVTLSTALAHFAQYGVNEGRTFNGNAALQPSNFDAETYAVANPDVAEYFGITDTSDLTPEQHDELLAHFLAHGIVEGRAGAGPEFEALINETAIEITAPDHLSAVGTVGDDLFVVNGGSITDFSVNGVQGNDTLHINNLASDITPTLLSVENVVANMSGDGGLTVAANSGVQSLTVNDNGGHTFAFAGNLLNTLSVDGGTFTGAFSGVSGTQDALTANLSAATNFTINGVETLNATLAADSAVYVIQDNGVQGADLTINLAGGTADSPLHVHFDSSTSSALSNVTVDASTAAGDLTLDSFGQLANVQTLTVDTGAGDDGITVLAGANNQSVTIDAGAGTDTVSYTASATTNQSVTINANSAADTVDTVSVTLTAASATATATVNTGAGNDVITLTTVAGQTATVNAGAGNDTIHASAGVDVLTGGAGADIFDFAAGAAVVQTQEVTDAGGAVTGYTLTGYDVVTDFQGVTNDSTTEHVAVADLVATPTAGAISGVGTVSAAGVLTFETGFLPAHSTLQSVVQALSANAAFGTVGDSVAFNFDGNAYVFVSDGDAANITGDSLIELTGVDAGHLSLTAGDVSFATA